MARVRFTRMQSMRKQRIYRAIEADAAREKLAREEKALPVPTVAPSLDERDPIEIAKAASSALKGVA